LRNELEESKKEAQLVRADMMAIEHTLKESNNEVARAMMDECLRFEKDFRKTVNIEKSENEFLRQQLSQLNQDKMKLQQNCLVQNMMLVSNSFRSMEVKVWHNKQIQ
jgi:3-methyladenine DNA glycosylase AlkC